MLTDMEWFHLKHCLAVLKSFNSNWEHILPLGYELLGASLHIAEIWKETAYNNKHILITTADGIVLYMVFIKWYSTIIFWLKTLIK